MSASPQDLAALAALRRAFATCKRPAHFTNYEHCEECAEHDQTLLSRTPDTLTFDDVGNPGWEPICFVSPEGFAYFLPGLARLVFEDAPQVCSWYGSQFFWHLILDGPGNVRFQFCSPEQRKAVAEFVAYLIESRPEQIEAEFASDDAVRAHQIWNGDESV
ncbi:MAG TPA: hypothetical protein VF522_00765 [Ramlibacter sp.]|uniref:hypothetical protein n=1 Tax=Ramlibacter sp. TaxID=1917967 RepID=UPI002ED47192